MNYVKLKQLVSSHFSKEIYLHRSTELTPFLAVPLFGPEAGDTVIIISYSFWAYDVITQDDFEQNVFVTMNALELNVTQL